MCEINRQVFHSRLGYNQKSDQMLRSEDQWQPSIVRTGTNGRTEADDVGRVQLCDGMTHAQRLRAEPTDGIF